MGFFKGLFKKKPKAKEPDKEIDRLIDYTISLLKDPEMIKKQVKRVSEIKKLPFEEREDAYLSAYLSLEDAIAAQRPIEVQAEFSSKILKGGKEYTREDIRKNIKKKIKINKLSDRIKLLFLEGISQNLLLYEVMCQEVVKGAARANAQIKKISPDKPLKGIKLKDSGLDFTQANKRLSKLDQSKLRLVFSSFLSMLYDKIRESGNKDLADEIIKRVYAFVQNYKAPISLAGMKILPIKTEEASIIAARDVIDYLTSLIYGKDLIYPQLEKLKQAEALPLEDKKRAYFTIYLELEGFIVTHLPPAVKKEFSKEELIKEIKNNIDINSLEHRFKLLFLEENEQIIELLLAFAEKFLSKLSSVLELNDLQKFVEAKTKGTLIEGIEVGREHVSLETVETRLSKLPKKRLDEAISGFANFFFILYKEAEMALGEEAKSLVAPLYSEMKERYGTLPSFNDFLRNVPGPAFEREKTISLGKKAAEEMVAYLLDFLKKEKIDEQRQKFEQAKTLPPEKQLNAFFNIYLELVHYITEYSPRIQGKPLTVSDVKENIRRKINIEDLEDKFQVLFLRQDELLIKLVKDLVKGCAANFIDKNAIIAAEKEIVQKEKLLRNVTIDEDGEFNFKPLHNNLKEVKDKVRALDSTLKKIIQAVFETAKRMLGEIQAKRLFETAYDNLQGTYGVNLLQVLKVVPKGILETKRYELLEREQLQKTATELTKVEILKGEFMNLAAHELKTPLVPIIGYLEMVLSDKKLKPDYRRKLEICLESAKREVDLVEDILDISKVESGTLKLEAEKLDMAELLQEAAAGFEVAAKQKKIYFKTVIPDKLSPVKGDRRRLIQVITNFLSNAMKFTEKGGVTVKAEERENDIMVSVEDTGIGLSQEDVKKLFTKFFQAGGPVATRKHKGTGLGLAICKGIIEGHNGKMGVKSELGKGTTFYFTIPVMTKEVFVKKEKKIEKPKRKPKAKTKRLIKKAKRKPKKPKS